MGVDIQIHGHDMQLTTREDEVLTLAGQGLTNKEIGRELKISPLTVSKHMEHICFKLKQPNRIKAFLARERSTA